ncbi:MAG: prealbumin-like fold domain-containing protein, partial [Actinomycetota bacterium]
MHSPIRPLARFTLTAAVALTPAVSSLGATAAYAQAAPAGKVTIVKDAQPNGPRNFQYTTDIRHVNEYNLDNFSLDDDPSSERPSTQVFEGVEPGTYYVVEHPQEGWTLESIDCTGDGATPDVSRRRVDLTVEDGSDITCTFVNVRVEAGEPVLPTPSPSPTTMAAPIQDGTSEQQPIVAPQALAAPVEPVELPAQLPRTGSGTGLLAALGAAMVAAGSALRYHLRRKAAQDAA